LFFGDHAAALWLHHIRPEVNHDAGVISLTNGLVNRNKPAGAARRRWFGLKNEVWQKGQPLRPLYYAIELEASYMALNQIQDMGVI
jgi:hypothetical protein